MTKKKTLKARLYDSERDIGALKIRIAQLEESNSELLRILACRIDEARSLRAMLRQGEKVISDLDNAIADLPCWTTGDNFQTLADAKELLLTHYRWTDKLDAHLVELAQQYNPDLLRQWQASRKKPQRDEIPF